MEIASVCFTPDTLFDLIKQYPTLSPNDANRLLEFGEIIFDEVDLIESGVRYIKSQGKLIVPGIVVKVYEGYGVNIEEEIVLKPNHNGVYALKYHHI